MSSVSGKGSIVCTSDLTLSSVLHVPSFPNNLLSISAITRDLNCKVTFFDCCSRTTWVYLMRSKSEVFSCFQSFHRMVSNQFNAKMKI